MIGSVSLVRMEAGRIFSGWECQGVEAAPNICEPECRPIVSLARSRSFM